MPDNEIVSAQTDLVPVIPGTSKYQPLSWSRRPQGGAQLVFRFPNGFGASLIHGPGTYGYELAVAKFTGPGTDDWDIHYGNEITGDRGVVGWLDAEEIEAHLDTINAFAVEQKAVTA